MKRIGLACAFFVSVAVPFGLIGGCGSGGQPNGTPDGGMGDAAGEGSSLLESSAPQESSAVETSANESGSSSADTGPDQGSEAASDAAPDQTAAEAAAESGAGDAGDAASDVGAEGGGAETGSEAAAESGAEAGADGGDGGAVCLGNVSIDFSSLAPDWVNASTACGTASVSGGSLVLTRNGTCTSDASGGTVSLGSALRLCGDFDIQVAFDLTAFTFPTAGGRYATMRAYDPLAPTNGISIERFDNDCGSIPVAYKSFTTDSNGCITPHAATTDASGKMRLTRLGATVTSYYFTQGDAGDAGGSWTQLKTDTLTTTPWALMFYTGYNPPSSGDTQSQSVSFSNLVIASGSTP